MKEIDKIEELFKVASDIWFYKPEDASKEPSVVLIGLSDDTLGAKAYDYMLACFKNFRTVLSVVEKDHKLDISIIDEMAGNVVNIRNLNYDKNNLLVFLQSQKQNKTITLFVGKVPASSRHIIATRDNFQPIVCDMSVTLQ